jgi:hypothetical protein
MLVHCTLRGEKLCLKISIAGINTRTKEPCQSPAAGVKLAESSISYKTAYRSNSSGDLKKPISSQEEFPYHSIIRATLNVCVIKNEPNTVRKA